MDHTAHFTIKKFKTTKKFLKNKVQIFSISDVIDGNISYIQTILELLFIPNPPDFLSAHGSSLNMAVEYLYSSFLIG